MPFFLPRRLIDFEYLPTGGKEDDEEAKRYRFDTDFAFFVVNFHMSRADYESLTQTEKAFIMKAYENKIVTETTLINNAVANAVANVNRKKGKRWNPLWKKRPKKSDTEELKTIMAKVKREDSDKSWVEKIYANNGRLPQLRRLLERREKGHG